MRLNKLAMILALPGFMLVPLLRQADAIPAAGPRITAVKAMLFYETKGTFSRDVLAKPGFSLWNTVIGEGDAEGPSSSTLVLVEVTGSTAKSGSTKVEFTATESGKLLLKRTSTLALSERDGKVFAPFWLYDTGCKAIKVTARLSGLVSPSTVTKTIPFACGE